MALSGKDLVTGFRDLGLSQGATVLVHSSLKSFGWVEGGADTVIDALMVAAGRGGTIIVPTLTGNRSDSPAHPPVFDVRTTPCWTGIIPETFRMRADAHRSLHPTHSVAATGVRAAWLTAGHESGGSPCDRSSPYFKNAEAGGFIMLIGVDQNSNTTIHCCEELAEVDYHLQQEATESVVTGYDGVEIPVRNRLHEWGKPPTDFNKFDERLERSGIMWIGSVGESTIRLIRAHEMVEFCVETLGREPHFLLV